MIWITLPLLYVQFIGYWPSVIPAKMNHCLPKGCLPDLEIIYLFLYPAYTKMAWVVSLSLNINVPPDPISIPKRGDFKVICPQTLTPQGAVASFDADALAARHLASLSMVLFSLICCHHSLRGMPQGPTPNSRGFVPTLSWFYLLTKTPF